ncbi:malonate decarboxylase holo-ACP synthase [Pseudalkalibacillus sp. A8]|uniref:malonate decarboxylase holo-ACP synthase n=1 Tax=Pseudalkalibacillus sp. A8 TaxID=3382641 RepID=UPI0038B436A8
MIQPHDLLKIKEGNHLIEKENLPGWLSPYVSDVRYVVVRRAPIIDREIPIGIRGKTRTERFGTFIPIGDVIERITPEQLAKGQIWKTYPFYERYDVFQALDLVESVLQQYQLSWGPTGSVGFELASGQPTITETSDLDIIIRTNDIPIDAAREIVSAFEEANVRIDPLVEMQDGAISLIEYSKGQPPILIRTTDGPKLINTIPGYN